MNERFIGREQEHPTGPRKSQDRTLTRGPTINSKVHHKNNGDMTNKRKSFNQREYKSKLTASGLRLKELILQAFTTSVGKVFHTGHTLLAKLDT